MEPGDHWWHVALNYHIIRTLPYALWFWGGLDPQHMFISNTERNRKHFCSHLSRPLKWPKIGSPHVYGTLVTPGLSQSESIGCLSMTSYPVNQECHSSSRVGVFCLACCESSSRSLGQDLYRLCGFFKVNWVDQRYRWEILVKYKEAVSVKGYLLWVGST